MNYDVIIVGASFAGLTLAHHLPKELKILLLDRKHSLDAGIESTGLITQATKDLLEGFTEVKKFIPNDITTICVISPDYNKYFFSHTETPWIYSTDTPLLVKSISEHLPSNVTLKISANVTKVEIDESSKDQPVTVTYIQNGHPDKKATTETVHGKFIVGADSAHSTVAKQIPALPKNKKFLAGLEKVYFGDIHLGDHPETSVYHFWFGEFSIGYGGWLSPTIIDGKNAFRVGLAKLQKDIKHLNKLDEFINILAEKKIITLTEEKKPIFTFGSLIPVGGPLRKPHTSHSILLGDAAGLCGAFAADGIKGAVISGQVAAKLIPRHLNGDPKALKEFYPRIQKDYHGMMKYYYKQLLYRFVWNRMKSDRSFHTMYDLVSRQKDSFLHQFCDSKDKNSSLIWVVLKFRNLPLLIKYAALLFLDLFKRSTPK